MIKAYIERVKKALMWRWKHYFDKNSMQINAWFRDDSKKQYRYTYDLNVNSIVFDVGGYEGEWAQKIYDIYGSWVYVFEPHPYYYKHLKERFKDLEKVKVFPYGLGGESVEIELSDSKDASSIHKTGEKHIKVKIIDIVEFLDNSQFRSVDLVKINIEGAEYDLLQRLIDAQRVTMFKNIQVQFHNFVDDAQIRMRFIQRSFSATHYLTYYYRFVWENWKLK